MPAEAARAPRREELRCWLGAASLPAREREALARRSRSADALERGRALSLLGRLSAARGALDLAAASGKARADALAWRAELELVGGGAERALSDADAALALDARHPYARLFRAAACWRLGRAEEAERELQRLPRGWHAAQGLAALLTAQRGDAAGARDRLDRALGGAREGWMLAFRAALRARAADLPGARADIEEALRLEDSPWARMERADIARRMGEFWVSLADLRLARRRLPKDPEPLRRLASIQLDQAQYGAALATLKSLLRLAPGDAGALQHRTTILLMQGKLAEAAASARDAAAARPDEPALREALTRALSIAGLLDEAETAAAGLSPADRRFWAAYALCRRGKRAEAALGFAEAARLAAPGSQRGDQARLYAAAAAVLAGLKPAPPAERPELLVVGLGYNQVRNMTAAGLEALARCERFFVNHSDPRVAEFLGLFPVPFEGVVFRGSQLQADTSAKRVMTGFARGHRRVAMVTRGQPIVYGVFAWELARCAKRAGIPWTLAPSVSIFDMAPAQADAGPEPGGLFVRDAADMDGLTGETPFVLYTPKAAECGAPAKLERLLEPERRCHLFPGGGEREFEPISFERRELRPRLEACDKACTLFVPAPARRAGRSAVLAAPRTAAAPKASSDPVVRVDGRLELLAAVRALAAGGGAAFGRGAHADAARARLDGLAAAASPAIEALRRARSLGLDETLAVVMAMHLSDPPDCALELEEHPWTGYAAQRELRRVLPSLARALARFARDSDFAGFLDSRREAYRTLSAPLAERAARAGYAAALERYTGLPFPARYSFLLSPLSPAGLRVNHVHGHDEVWSAAGPVSAREPERMDLPHSWKIWHELGRTTLDRLLEPHAALIASSEGLWAAARENANGASSWRHCLAEHLSQCVALRLWSASPSARGGEPPRLEGVAYSGLVLEELQGYERDRAKYPTIARLYPTLLRRFAREAA